jgi:hypothetical protein
MSADQEAFFAWFEQPIKALQPASDCAFAVVILCFPLLERYLRETSGCGEGDLTNKFYEDLQVIFPELATLDQAKQFWHVYRNGLLHQGAFSAANRRKVIMPFGAISGETPRISYDAVTDTFYVNPVPFSDAVLDFIRDDLATLAAAAAANHEIPYVAQPYSPGGGGFPFTNPPTGNFPQ